MIILLPALGALIQIPFIVVYLYDAWAGYPITPARTEILPLNLIAFGFNVYMIFWLSGVKEA